MDTTLPGSSELPNDWTMEDEVSLLYAAIDNRPLGIFKHIQMALITQQFMAMSDKTLKDGDLWGKYSTWYNLEELDKREQLPFDNKVENFKFPAEFLTKEEIEEYKTANVQNALDFNETKRSFTIEKEDQKSDATDKHKITQRKNKHSTISKNSDKARDSSSVSEDTDS